jgi:DNA polymerase-1
MLDRLPFKAIWILDFEFHQPDGCLPDPLCVVARELRSGVEIARWLRPDKPGPVPYDTGPESLFVAHYSSAEWLCHVVQDWPLPCYVLDTYAETRAARNGLEDGKSGLLEAASRYGIATISNAAKEAGREIAVRGRQHAEQHKARLLKYCGTDVATNAELLLKMLPGILAQENGLPLALIRGAYMRALAHVQHVGVPFDCPLFARLQANWQGIRHRLIAEMDTGVFDCYVNGRFNRKRFSELLDRLGLLQTWPKSETMGWPTTEEDVFRERAQANTVLNPLFELHNTLERLKQLDLPVGPDDRHRAKSLQAFGTNTGRNAPRGFAFAPAVWVRFLIRPQPGWAIVYSDYSAQEIHIAARKSGDPMLIEAVESGDPYLWYARKTGMAPPDASKISHANLRNEILKPFQLSVHYGASAYGIAQRVGVTYDFAEHVLLESHTCLFRTYWQWAHDALYTAVANKRVLTRFGWPLHVTPNTKFRSLLNHQIQSAGADILRLALIGLVANGVRVCAPIHDAVLTECRLEDIDGHVATVQRIMRKAAKVGLGHEIPVDSRTTKFPDHYFDERGAAMYARITKLLGELEIDQFTKSHVHRLPNVGHVASFAHVAPVY